MEKDATFTLQQVAATAFMLYMCTSGRLPFLVHTDIAIAPFALDMVSKIF